MSATQPAIKPAARRRNAWRARPETPALEALFAWIVAAGMLAIEIRIFAVALLG